VADFSNVTAASNQRFTRFPTVSTTLPALSFVVPNLCNDMHDCSVAAGGQVPLQPPWENHRAGLSRIDSRCQVILSVAARRMCGIGAGPPVVPVAVPCQGLLVVHAAAVLTALLAGWYTSLIGSM
jgi:hypothetical protein